MLVKPEYRTVARSLSVDRSLQHCRQNFRASLLHFHLSLNGYYWHIDLESTCEMENGDEESRRSSAASKSNYYGSIGSSNNLYVLPFFKQPNQPPALSEIPIIASLIPEACGTKIITGGVMGAVIGIGLGAFMGAMGDVSPIQIVNGREVPVAPLREQMRGAFKSTAAKTGGWAKSFGILTALFGGVECVVEKYRAKHDVWNPVISGCVVGATLSAKGGPAVSACLVLPCVYLLKQLIARLRILHRSHSHNLQASCIGCVGFAGFSLVVDKIMGPH